MIDWIRREEERRALIKLQIAIRQQMVRHGKRTPEEIAAALGEPPERIAEVIHELDRHYGGTWSPLQP